MNTTTTTTSTMPQKFGPKCSVYYFSTLQFNDIS